MLDECLICGGSGIQEGKCDCAGNVLDCEGVCGAGKEIDECGVCGGVGVPEGDCDCNAHTIDCHGICGG